MRKFADKSREDLTVFCVRLRLIHIDHLLDGRILRACLRIDRDGLPGVAVDAVVVHVDHDVEASDLVRSGSRLNDRDPVHLRGLGQERVRVSADDHVDAPRGVQQSSQFLVLLKADVGEQDRKIDIQRIVRVADAADLVRSVLKGYEGADQIVLAALRERDLGDDADEQDLHAVDLNDLARREQSLVVRGDVQVRVDDRELRAFFEKQQMRKAVVNLVVAHRHDVRSEDVHDLNRGDALELGVDDGASEHVAGDGVDDVLLLLAHLVDVTGEHGNAAHQVLIDIFREEVSVHVVGVEQRKFFRVFHFLLNPFRSRLCRRLACG